MIECLNHRCKSNIMLRNAQHLFSDSLFSGANNKLTSAEHGLRLETRMAYGVWCSVWFAVPTVQMKTPFFA